MDPDGFHDGLLLPALRSDLRFPTVTRVNATSITTGTIPSHHGIASNSVYLPAISRTVLSNGDYRNLLSLGQANGGRSTIGE